MSRSSVTEQFVRTVGTFAWLGPLVGVGIVWIGLIGLSLFTGDEAFSSGSSVRGYLTGLPGAVLLTVAVGYVVGVLPAAATGVICHFFSRSIRSDAVWILASAAVGATSSALALAIMIGSGDLLDYFSLGLIVVPGTGAAAVCAWKLRQSRWA